MKITKEEDLKKLKEECTKIENKYKEIQRIELKIKHKGENREWSWNRWYIKRKPINKF